MIGTGCEGKEIRARVVEEEGDRLTSPRRGREGGGGAGAGISSLWRRGAGG
jgi:hypothetical protein